jgi:hypothetical protein
MKNPKFVPEGCRGDWDERKLSRKLAAQAMNASNATSEVLTSSRSYPCLPLRLDFDSR